MKDLQNLEQLNPQNNEVSSKQILSNSDWTDSTLDTDARKAIQDLLVEFHNKLVKQRFEVSINKDFNVKLTPIDENVAYRKSLPSPINLKEGLTISFTT